MEYGTKQVMPITNLDRYNRPMIKFDKVLCNKRICVKKRITYFKNLIWYNTIRIFRIKSLVFIVLFLAIAATAYYFYDQNKKTLSLLNNPAQATELETKELTEKVGKLMTLPDEKPTIISVVDKEKVKDQPFFIKAENGDKVLVYTAAKKAILYRPIANKIIEVGPVDIGPDKTFKVALYNATSDPTKPDSIEKILKQKLTNLEFTIKAQAVTKTDDILVIDLVGDKKTETDQLAKLLGGTVSTLSRLETKPDTDFLIIIGK